MADSNGPPPPYPGPDPAMHEKAGYPPPSQPGYPPAQPGYPPVGPAQPGYPAQPAPYPAQPGYPAGPQPPAQQVMHPVGTNTVVITSPTVLTQTFREVPVNMQCPHCHSNIVTAVMYETGTLTWLACVILFLVGCSLGCCLIPFCVDSAKDAVHMCPSCNNVLGRYNRL